MAAVQTGEWWASDGLDETYIVENKDLHQAYVRDGTLTTHLKIRIRRDGDWDPRVSPVGHY